MPRKKPRGIFNIIRNLGHLYAVKTVEARHAVPLLHQKYNAPKKYSYRILNRIIAFGPQSRSGATLT